MVFVVVYQSHLVLNGRVSLERVHLALHLRMSSAPPPANPPSNNDKKSDDSAPSQTPASGDAAEMDTAPDVPVEETWADIPEDILALNNDEILTRVRLLDNDIKVGRCSPPRTWGAHFVNRL